MCLIRNCVACNVELIRLFQSVCYKYDVYANMTMGMIKSRITLF